MTRREPKHKGVGLLAVVKGLKANPRAQGLVPPELCHYLAQPILPSGWYPERDYNVLIELLARHVDRTAIDGGDVWAYFGRTAARRDIGGEQDGLPEHSRTETAGVYRKFWNGSAGDLAGLFLRLEKIWGLYHDSGQLRIARHAEQPCTVVMRIIDFSFPFRGLVDLQTSFALEYARLMGVALTASVMRSIKHGAAFWEWHYRVQQSAENVAAIGALPAPHPSLPLDIR